MMACGKWLRILCILVLIPTTWNAAHVVAQTSSCLEEVEPNNDPAGALALQSVEGCVEGTIGGQDQDFVAWTLSETDARQRWSVTMSAIPGQAVVIRIATVVFAADGATVESFQDIANVTSDASQPTILEDLFLPANTYYIGVVASGDGDYTLTVSPGTPLPANADAEPNDATDTASPVSGEFAVSGDQLGSPDWYSWTISDADATSLWELSLNGIASYPPVIEIRDQSGTTILAPIFADSSGKYALEEVGLSPGIYTIIIGPGQTFAAPYVLSATSTGPPQPDQEIEPNGGATTAIQLDLTKPARGRITAGEPTDMYVFTIDDTLAGSLLDVKLAWKNSGLARRLCLLDGQQNELTCKDGKEGVAVRNLRLPAGDIYVQISGDVDPDDLYILRVDTTTAVDPNFESEPNDTITHASALDVSNSMKGRIGGEKDVDSFRFTVTGAPQLWKIELTGTSIGALYLVNSGNQPEQTARAGDGGDPTIATLWDVFLVPGDHFVQVTGTSGDYSIALTPLGPPNPNAEREPNGDLSRAHLLLIGQNRTGRLPNAADVDVYRFFVAAPEHVKFTVTPPADGTITYILNWGSSWSREVGRQSAEETGKAFVYDVFLQPGDYWFSLTSSQPSESPYSVVMERGDPFLLPVDREPNERSYLPAPLPEDLTAHGYVPANGENDCYAVPAQSQGSMLSVAVQGEVAPTLFDGAIDLGLFQDPTSLNYRAAIPLNKPLTFCVYGNGDYAFRIAIDGQPELPELATPEPNQIAAGPVELTLTPAQIAVAAYWTEGQRIDAELSITNKGDAPKQLALQAVTSDLTWTAELGETSINVGPGETVSVSVTVDVLPDPWGGRPVRITVAATDESGAVTTGWTEIAVERDAPPANPKQAWSVPDELLGGLNVAATALGAVPVSSSDGQPPEAINALFDDLVVPGMGFQATRSNLPVTVTIDLAGDEPLPIGGVILDPEPLGGASTYSGSDQLRDFEILLSTDGINFTPVYQGVLTSRTLQQSFVFEQPVEASFAQLIIHSTYSDDSSNAVLGEWRVIAEPGVVPNSVIRLNIANPLLGGHFVRSAPQLTDLIWATNMFLEEDSTAELYAEDGTIPSLTIGFNHGRAAQITGFEWIDGSESNPDGRFTEVDVSVSTESPTGPWTSVGTWALDRAVAGEGQLMSFELDDPVWARFVRFTSLRPVPDGGGFWEFPSVLRVFERETDDEYRSIIGAWGFNTPVGIYEKLEPPVIVSFGAETVPNNTPEQAQALQLGDTVSDAVQISKDVDWYEVEVPQGMNQLEFTVTGGTPADDVVLTVIDDQENDVPVSAVTPSADVIVFSVPVVAGETYKVKVEQPRPSIVLAYDTSQSIGNLFIKIYAALNAFASEVVPGQEQVNILPFGENLLLDDWQDEPFVLQQAINNYPRTASGSDSPDAVVKSTRALQDQPGAKAILLITDAVTELGRQAEAWPLVDGVRPRIFTVFVAYSTEQSRLLRAMMEDWALVNEGYFVSISSQGDLDVAFDRVATYLRRPAAYTLTAEAILAPTPTPEPTSTPMPTPTLTPTPTLVPTATPEATATPAEPGRVYVVVPPPEENEPVLVAENVAVEIVLDTSGSMLQPLEGSTRAEVAKATLIDLVTNTIPPGTALALRIFGQTPDSCETSLAVPLQPLDPASMSATIQNIPIVNLVRTPLGESLRQVANDLKDVDGPKIIVLVTDGEETCGGDAEAAIRELVSQGIDVHVNIVGFALDDQALKDTFARWARIGQGVYIDAANAEELAAAVEVAVQAPFRVLDANGNVVATGVVGGGSVQVPAGTYTIEVLTDPVRRVEGVVIEPGERTRVELEDD